jgi:hypothetical protein
MAEKTEAKAGLDFCPYFQMTNRAEEHFRRASPTASSGRASAIDVANECFDDTEMTE